MHINQDKKVVFDIEQVIGTTKVYKRQCVTSSVYRCKLHLHVNLMHMLLPVCFWSQLVMTNLAGIFNPMQMERPLNVFMIGKGNSEIGIKSHLAYVSKLTCRRHYDKATSRSCTVIMFWISVSRPECHMPARKHTTYILFVLLWNHELTSYSFLFHFKGYTIYYMQSKGNYQ